MHNNKVSGKEDLFNALEQWVKNIRNEGMSDEYRCTWIICVL